MLVLNQVQYQWRAVWKLHIGDPGGGGTARLAAAPLLGAPASRAQGTALPGPQDQQPQSLKIGNLGAE